MTEIDVRYHDRALEEEACRRINDDIRTGAWLQPVVARLNQKLTSLRPLSRAPVDHDVALHDGLDGRTLLEARFHWHDRDASLEPLQLLDRGGGVHRCYFRSRDLEETFITAGAVLATSSLPSVLTSRPGLRWFGGIPFHHESKTQKQKESSSFDCALFLLPILEWRCQPHDWHLCLRTFIDPRKIAAITASQPNGSLVAAMLLDLMEKHLTCCNDLPDKPHLRLLASENLPSFDHFTALMDRALSRMKPSNPDSSVALSKVVLARCKRLTLSTPDVDHRLLLDGLSTMEEPSYLFAFEMPDGEVFLGRPPERILRWREGSVEVDAIAGTIPRDHRQDCDEKNARQLASSPKDLNEHRWVADFIAETLADCCEAISRDQNETILKLKNMQHIVTRFRARLKPDVEGRELLLRLHPTPAVGGVPAKAALKFLSEAEPFERRWFAGAVGYSDGASGDFAIAIRSAFLKGQSLTLIAGAGIVEGSLPAAEWGEIELKFKNFLDLCHPAGKQGEETAPEGAGRVTRQR